MIGHDAQLLAGLVWFGPLAAAMESLKAKTEATKYMPAVASDPPQYLVLIPVKPPAIGKSRLTGVTVAHRRALAEAFALDAVAACVSASSVAQILVVTEDVPFATRVIALGATSIPDGAPGDLNGTLRGAAATGQARWPHLRPVALVADLPSLRPADLNQVLGRIGAVPAFVPDVTGTGTTLYIATFENFDPHFGPGSREAHLSVGAREIRDAPASVRRDVDNVNDLRDAVPLGLGANTAGLVPFGPN